MTHIATKDLREYLRTLRVVLPPILPVRVRVTRMAEDDQGECQLVRPKASGPYFVIRISKALDAEALVHVLTHEWAHALAWQSDATTLRDHGVEWGIAYARVWTALIAE